MNLSSFLAELPADVVSWGVPVGAAGLAFAAILRYLAKTKQKRAIAKCLRRIAREHLRDVAVPDGLGGVVQIDRLLLASDRLLVLDIKNFEGVIFGGAGLETWTQIVGSKSYRFANPVSQNLIRVQAVRALAPGVPVTGCVVFTESARFPKGLPQGVFTLETLPKALNPEAEGATANHAGAPATGGLQAAWHRIREITLALEHPAKA